MATPSEESRKIAELIVSQLAGKTDFDEATLTVAVIIQAMTDKLAVGISRMMSEMAVPRSTVDRLAKSLEMCAENDKTVYDYRGKDRLNRNGGAPREVWSRFKTPREIATDALAEYRKAVG